MKTIIILIFCIKIALSSLACGTNVYDFGAKGDGNNDDTGAFKLAITAALKDDRFLFIPSGEYLLSGINLPANNFHILGEGAYSKGGTRLILGNNGDCIFKYSGKAQCHTLIFEKIVFNCSGMGDGIRLYGSGIIPKCAPFNIYVRDVRFEHCRIGFFAPRVFASELRNISIDHCTLGGIVGLHGPSNILQSIILQHIPKNSIGIHIYGNNTYIVGLNASFGASGPCLVIGKSRKNNGQDASVAWVMVESSHFENFDVIPVEVRGGSYLGLSNVEFLANEKGSLKAFIHILYGNRSFNFNNVRFHSKGVKVRQDVLVTHAENGFKIIDIKGIRSREIVDKVKKR